MDEAFGGGSLALFGRRDDSWPGLMTLGQDSWPGLLATTLGEARDNATLPYPPPPPAVGRFDRKATLDADA